MHLRIQVLLDPDRVELTDRRDGSIWNVPEILMHGATY